jgi:alpha-beta hydrolase superfamily lysophospholipase
MSSYVLSEISFPSADGKSTVHGEIYAPLTGEVRGVVQLSHGMVDYVGRYRLLAEFLTSHGYVFAGNDHLGHGKTAASDSDFGYFADEDGVLCVLKDLHSMNKHLRATYSGVPIVLMGHSMGSFLSRLYVERHPHSMTAHIIHGTGGPNPLLPFGKALAGWKTFFRGKKYRSKTLASLAFSGYNARFDKSEGKNAWLSRDGSMVNGRDDDKYTSFIFTISAYSDLFRMVGESNSKAWFASYPKELPTLVISGSDDPVGSFGKGPDYVYKQLMVSGVGDVTLKLYEGARHELFNETNRDEVFRDMLAWIEGVHGK